MRIHIDNATHYRNDHIRAFVAQAMKVEREDLCKRGALPMRVKVGYIRNGGRGSSGYAYYHRNYIKVRLPKANPDKVDFAFVIAHELAHTRGMKHSSMRGCPQYRRVGRYREIYGWAEQLPLDVQQVKPRQRPTVDDKLAHVQRMLKVAVTREKRATTLRKKWEAKLKYYTKKAQIAVESRSENATLEI